MNGGSVRSVQTYSYAAGEVILPHIIGSTDGLVSGHSPWSQIVGHAELIVMFGGTPLRNAQVNAGAFRAMKPVRVCWTAKTQAPISSTSGRSGTMPQTSSEPNGWL